MATLLLVCCLSAADPAEVTVRAVDEAGLRVEVRRLLSPAEQARFAEGESIAARDARRLLIFRLRDAAAPLFGKYKRAGRWRWFNSDDRVDPEEAKECGLHIPMYNI